MVVATGYDSHMLLAPLEIDLPIRKQPRYFFLSEPIRDRLLEPLVVSIERQFAIKQLANGRVLAGDLSAGANGEGDAEVDGWRRSIRANIEHLLPRLQYVSFPMLVAGFYDLTPDHQPIIGEMRERLWVAAGFSGHGFMLAPAIGRRIAAAIAGDPVDTLLESFALRRFAGQAAHAGELVV
jgi:sarcosine oxidase subunit beta